jgi:hypothetical protein
MVGRRVTVYLRLIALPLVFLAVPVASASASLTMEALAGGPTTSDRTPTFNGSTSDNIDPITVVIYQGARSQGIVATATGSPSSGTWSATPATPLEYGTYTAVAEQPELGGLGPPSVTAPYRFTVEPLPPVVTLDQPPSRSNHTTPSFAGTASAETAVVVHIYEGSVAAGIEVSTATAAGTGGAWATGAVSPSLARGEHTYTAVATQESPLGNSAGRSNSVTFTVDTLPPTVTLDQPPARSGDTTPSFSGTASAETPVVVHVYEGTVAGGIEVSSATASGTASAWTSGPASPALAPGEHTYTALATQESPLGNPEGVSNSVTFAVETLPPTVTLDPLPVRSNDATPSFSGTASDTTVVTVEVFRGARPQGSLAAAVRVSMSGGNWTSANVSPPLANGEYTAVATQSSSLGNGNGVSNPVTFEVDTASPLVTLKTPASPSNQTAPSFSGTASEATPVTVEIFEGSRPEGDLVATVVARNTPGSWTSGPVTPALPRGRHAFTALAIQTSAIKNPAGKSAPVTFVVNTEPPSVTLKAPPSPSSDTTPSFSGTTSEGGTVSVEIFAGSTAEGNVLARGTSVPTAGSWTSTHATPALPDGTFTAQATQPSAIGNAAGRSSPVIFTIDTAPPTVTLNALPALSGDATPSFSGTASDDTSVTIDVYRTSHGERAVVASTTTRVANGEWTSERLSHALPWGEYTAVARQPSSIGNPPGSSSAAAFAVEPIAPTVATAAASAVARTSAALYASVDPAGGTVSACSFEYGTTASYGTSVECGFVSEATAFPPFGAAPVPVFARIYGLTASTNYHFRIVAVGEGGTAAGADETFTTLAACCSQQAPKQVGSAAGTAASVVAALIARQLAPHGRGARIASLSSSGVFSAMFRAPEAGTAQVDWYYLQRGGQGVGRGAGNGASSRVLIASGARTFRAAGSAALKIHLTAAGRRLLKGSQRVRLTATCVFTPLGQTPVRTSATFELHH